MKLNSGPPPYGGPSQAYADSLAAAPRAYASDHPRGHVVSASNCAAVAGTIDALSPVDIAGLLAFFSAFARSGLAVGLLLTVGSTTPGSNPLAMA